MDPLHSQPSQEYPIRALVRANNDIGLPKDLEGKVSNWKSVGWDLYDSEQIGYCAMGEHLIIDPTPEQIAEERAKAGLPAETAPAVPERIYLTPSGLRLRMLKIGEIVRDGDLAWHKEGSVEKLDPIRAGAGIGRVVTAEMGNAYYRPIQGAPEGEALPEAPAEGSPSLTCPHGIGRSVCVDCSTPSAPAVPSRTFSLMYRDNGVTAWWSVMDTPDRGLHPDGHIVKFNALEAR